MGIESFHIIKLENNYWEIGEGPCGPDSEIFYDRGSKYDPDNIGIDLIKKKLIMIVMLKYGIMFLVNLMLNQGYLVINILNYLAKILILVWV